MPKTMQKANETETGKYKCTNCNYSTDIKSRLDTHNSRKTPCNIEKQRSFKCDGCEKTFVSKSPLEKHKKDHCKKKKPINPESINMDELKKIIKSNQKFHSEIVRLNDVITKLTTVKFHKPIHITQNITTIINTKKIDSIKMLDKVTLLSYRNPNTDYITKEDIAKIITKSQRNNISYNNIITGIFKLIYLNKDHPENHSVIVNYRPPSNWRSNYKERIHAFNGTVWFTRHRTKMMFKVVPVQIKIISQKIYEFGMDISNTLLQNLINYEVKYTSMRNIRTPVSELKKTPFYKALLNASNDLYEDAYNSFGPLFKEYVKNNTSEKEYSTEKPESEENEYSYERSADEVITLLNIDISDNHL